MNQLLNNPLVSVVVASYNMGQYVCEAVDSVLAQDYSHVEVIVVNDGSEDDTGERLKQYEDNAKVRIINQPNGGQTVAKNRGLQEATGDYIGFCDADNYWLPGKLSRQLQVYAENPQLGVVYGDLQLIDENGNTLPENPVRRHSGRITGRLLCDNFVTFNTTLIPRHVLDKVGGFDERLRMGIDYELWLRISVDYEFYYLPQRLVAYRIWGGQMSNRTGERFENFFRLMNNFLKCYPNSVTPEEIRKGWAYTYVSRGTWKISEKNYAEGLKDYFKAFKHSPLDQRLWKSFVKLCIGRK